MRLLCFLALTLTAGVPAFAQTAANAAAGLPSDPRAIFAAAAPFYDFNSPDMKPWHLKASYQLYDDHGKPTEQGTFEYWWASPTVNRTTWTRAGATHTVWHTADGKEAYEDTGEPLNFFAYELRNDLLSPLPAAGGLDPQRVRLEQRFAGSGSTRFICETVTPLLTKGDKFKEAPPGLYPAYCFDPGLPVLRDLLLADLSTEFNQIVKVQDRFLPHDIEIFVPKRKILSAHVEEVNFVSSSNPALTPAADAVAAKTVSVPFNALTPVRRSVKGLPLHDPEGDPRTAERAPNSGRVVLDALIGTDGGVRDLHVISAPYPTLALQALWATSQSEFKPYRLHGVPVEVKTIIHVDFMPSPLN